MKSVLLLNGSSRGERSNTMMMLAHLAEGCKENGSLAVEIRHLALPADFSRAAEAFAAADAVLIGLPLYTDAMPGLVKSYLEALAPRVSVAAAGGRNPILGFLVQSGFPEALHSRTLERYFEKLARRLGSPYAGTIVRGAGEALAEMPPRASCKVRENLRKLGRQFADEGRFHEAELRAVAGIERFSALSAALLAIGARLGIVQFFWDRQLKKNGVWEKRFAAPYGEAFIG